MTHRGVDMFDTPRLTACPISHDDLDASRRVMEKAGFVFERSVDHEGHELALYRLPPAG